MEARWPIALSPVQFLQPDQVSLPDSWVEHIPFAFWLIENHRPDVLVELGTHTGNSYLAFCQAIAHLGLGAKAFAVDTWQGDEHAGHYGERVFDKLSRYHDVRYSGFSKLLRATFDDALKGFSDGSIDLLHIDGMHTYDAVKHDFETWRQKLSPRGVVLFHDTNVHEHGFGVFQFWDEVKRDFPSFEFLHCNGLGVLGVGKDLSVELKALFESAAAPRPCQQVRSVFARLGACITARVAIEYEEHRKREAHERLAELTRHYDAAMGQVEGLRAELGTLSEQKTLSAEHARDTQERLHDLTAHYQAAMDQLKGLRVEATALSEAKMRSEAAAEALEIEVGALRVEAAALSEAKRRSEEVSGVLRIEAAALSEAKTRTEAAAEALRVQLATLAEAKSRSDEVAEARQAELNVFRAWVSSPRWLGRRFLGATARRLGVRIGSQARAGGVSDHGSSASAGIDDASVIRRSMLFDDKWYREHGPEFPATVDSVQHYLEVGWREGRNPNPAFDTAWYLDKHADVREAGLNPLLHFIANGAHEGRAPAPNFDPRWYVKNNPDVAASGADPMLHYLTFGLIEGRAGNEAAIAHDSFFTVKSRRRLDLKTVEALRDRATQAPAAARNAAAVKVDVIIPVYGGLDETKRCIESAIASRLQNHCFSQLILVDDCGPDPALRTYLQSVSHNAFVTLLTNPKNLGFVQSVNRGMQESGDADVVLLNSDAEVSGDWLDRMAAQAYSDERIGTVTPLSNNATICSYPDFAGRESLPGDKTNAQMDAICAVANRSLGVELPTAVGFCMYIKRACLLDVGLFDSDAFGRGYGEETDFSQKALARNWRHWLAGDVFVYHAGGVSFGATAERAKASATVIMRERYPNYEADVAAWISEDPGYFLRGAISAALLRGSGSPVVLHITHPWGGGTEKHIAELTRSDDGAKHVVLFAQVDTKARLTALIPVLDEWESIELEAPDMAAAAPLFDLLGVTRVRVHHNGALRDQLPSFLQRLNKPFDVTVHDYALICPRQNLARQGVYCGEPDEQGCADCLSQSPSAQSRDIIWWRQRGRQLLEDAEQVLCPTDDVKRRIAFYAPEANVKLAPHEPASRYQPKRRKAFTPSLAPTERLRVVSLGIQAEHKGGGFLLDCVAAGLDLGRAIEWTVIGEFQGAVEARARKYKAVLTATGRYTEAELPRIIGAHNPHLIFFPQHVPETYSFTLSEAFESGRAILAPDLGAFSERIAGSASCWSYDVGASPEQVVQEIERIRAAISSPDVAPVRVESERSAARYAAQAAPR